MSPSKILAIKFKYLGDIAIMVPSLRALREHYPQTKLHVLIPQEAFPLLQHLPWIDQIWPFPRTHGKWRLKESFFLLNALRKERFDASIDFVGNDRGALLSRLIGAKRRLGLTTTKGFHTRKLCYTETREELDTTRHEVIRDLYLLQAWNVPLPSHLSLEIRPDPSLADKVKAILGEKKVLLAHLSTRQEKKEWPIENWAKLYQKMQETGENLKFSSGPSPREQALLKKLEVPSSAILPPFPDLDLFLATLAQVSLLISPDTAPLHFAAGLGIPTIGLFGPTASSRWNPLGEKHRALQGDLCPCSGHASKCTHTSPCIATISVERVWKEIHSILYGTLPPECKHSPK